MKRNVREQDSDARPAIEGRPPSLDGYDTILLAKTHLERPSTHDHDDVHRSPRLPRQDRPPGHHLRAGPVGATAALLLANFAIPVTLLGRHRRSSQSPRAVHLDDEVARTLFRAGVGEEFLARSRPGSGCACLMPGIGSWPSSAALCGPASTVSRRPTCSTSPASTNPSSYGSESTR
ncbi:FAD-dependent monooxygenase [Streptomyces sp. NPDC016845]|uniref:FAD-dependent monooxygenase n=1 Tax=Streptomyces sp. NPDC016845 TaxID=3364972 RepID=UPI0037AA0394